MLIHHFGSKQELLTQALAASAPRVPLFDTSARLDDTILGIWHAMAEGSQRARVMLTLEVRHSDLSLWQRPRSGSTALRKHLSTTRPTVVIRVRAPPSSSAD